MKLIHYKILTIVLAVLFVGLGVFYIQNVGSKSLKKISSDEAAKRVLAYINDKVLNGQRMASLISINEDKNMGLYKLKVSVNSQVFETYVTLDGNTLFPDAVNLGTQNQQTSASLTPPAGQTVDGDFVEVANQEIIKENGKPVIYFFGATSCPHCHWEYPIIKKVAAQFGDKIAFHDNMITNASEMKDKNVFYKYSTGGVPVIVLAGRYYREGSGEQIGEQKETEVLTKLIQSLL